jgi:hypothetical protein
MSPNMTKEDRISVLRSLDPDLFEAIHEAISSHEDAVEREVDEAKKSKGIASASPATLPSPVDAAGGMNGSENSIPTSMRSSSRTSKPKSTHAPN